MVWEHVDAEAAGRPWAGGAPIRRMFTLAAVKAMEK